MPEQRMTGIIHVTGEHDVGKTTFAFQGAGALGNRVLFIDDDVKGRATYQGLKEAGVDVTYWNLREWAKGSTELAFHEKVVGEIHKIKPDQFDVVIWDTWTRTGASFHSFVVKYPHKFRTQWSSMGKFKGPQQWKEARQYEADVLDYLNQRVPTVFLITHLAPYYENEVRIPGKYKPDASNALDIICRARFWLRQNETGRPVPTALVLKRPMKMDVNNGLFQPINALPRKLVPGEEENSLWSTIWRYWENPVGDRQPTEEEALTPYELSLIDGTLTEDEQVIYHKILDMQQLQAEEESAFGDSVIDAEIVEAVKERGKAGKPPPLIAQEFELSVSTVQEILSTVEMVFAQ